MSDSKVCEVIIAPQKPNYIAPLQLAEVELYDAAGALIPGSSLSAGLTSQLAEGSNGPADACIDGEAHALQPCPPM